jgi:hypothetical protein
MKDNRNYVGMDVHKATTVIVELNQEGKEKMRMVVETKAENIMDAIGGLKGEIHVSFEEGIQSAWL